MSNSEGEQVARRIPKSSSSKTRPASKRWSNPENSGFSVSPPVCSVHPGKVLELSTILGVNRLKSIVLDPMKVQETEALPAELSVNGSYFVQNRCRLKSGRLQPLGLHADPELSSQTCLGVVSVDSPKKRHLRSFTAPLSRTSSKQGCRQWDSMYSKLPPNRRVCSAFPYSNVSHSRLTMTVNPIGIAAENNPKDPQLVSKTEKCDLRVMQHSKPRLPPLGAEKESARGITVELNAGKKSIKKAALPDIATDTNSTDEMLTLAVKLELSVDESLFLQHTSMKKRVRRPSGNSSAKLSHGWTDPQPLTPVIGRQPPTTSIRRPAKEESTKNQEKEEESTSIPNSVNIDVNELLNRTESSELNET